LVIPWGPIINSVAVAVGASIGIFLGSLIPERMRTLLFQLFGLCLVVIAVDMSLGKGSAILVILSCALGALTGELLNVSGRLDSLGNYLKGAIKSANPDFTEGLVNSSILVCVGAMSIVGAFEEGLGNGRNIVFTKSTIDFFAVIILASRFGSGVIFCSVPVLLYQGTLTVLAIYLQPFVTPAIEATLTGTGGILILGIAFNMIGIKVPVNIANAIPSLVWAVILAAIIS
jgi:uncharacterized membrane protein YqgA involved in biofilm formation